MNSPITSRRALVFVELSEVVPEVRRLLAGHRALGQWTIAQACRHLADTINASMDGFDLRRHRIKRWFFSKPLLAYTYRWGIPSGYTVDPRLTPPPDAELAAAQRDLEAAVARYQAHAGRLHAHPLFGRLSRKGWDRLHCFHCAHHLSFILPQGPATGTAAGADGLDPAR